MSRKHRKCVAVSALLCVGISLLATASQLRAQARYDDSVPRDRFKLRLGSFEARGVSSTARIDSGNLRLGTLLDLERDLNVENSARVFRLDGYYRFNRAHRLEWGYYSMEREGSTGLSRDIRIARVEFPIGLAVDTELAVEVAEVGYVWSFINVELYEFYLGAGLNVRDIALTTAGRGLLNGTERRYDDGGTLPMPTITAGARYNVLEKLSLNFKIETFSLKIEDQSGRLQDTQLLVEYDVTPNFSIGGGLNLFNLDLNFHVDDDFSGEIRSSHRGILLFLAGSF